MANPQKEDGYMPIANEIGEYLMNINLTAYQYRVLWVIWRKTYGWNKKDDWISNSQLVEMTGLHKSHISRTVKQLIEKNIITRNGNKLSFNKNYHTWIELPNRVTVTPSGNTVTNRGNKVTRIGGHKRHYTNNTNTKENNIKENNTKEKAINEIWEMYKEIFKGIYSPRKLTNEIKIKIKLRLEEYSKEDIEKALKNMRNNPYLTGENKNNRIYCKPSYCFRSFSMIEDWLNQSKKQEKELFEDWDFTE